MDLCPSPRQPAQIDRAFALATEPFGPRAALHDREASRPFDDYADLHTSGLPGLCVPAQYGAACSVARSVRCCHNRGAIHRAITPNRLNDATVLPIR
jgi:hypothetical protein